MHFDTIRRDEVLPMLDQAKDKKEQKKILCDLLDCSVNELNTLIGELEAKRDKASGDDTASLIKVGIWSDTEIEQLRKLCAAGKTRSEIAKTLRRNPKSVTYKMSELKLRSNDAIEKKTDADAKSENDQVAEIAAYAKELEKEAKLLKENNKRLRFEMLDLERANTAILEKLKKAEGEADFLRNKADKEQDAAVAEGDAFHEELEAAWAEADKFLKENNALKESARLQTERMSRVIFENKQLYGALSKAVGLAGALDELIRMRG